MEYCGIQSAKIIGGNLFSPFSSINDIYFFNYWKIILHNQEFFVTWIKYAFIIKVFNMFKKHFLEIAADSGLESSSNGYFMKFRMPIHYR